MANPDIFFWPYFSQNESQFGETSPVDVVFVGKTRKEVLDFMQEQGMSDFFLFALDEYGYRGPDLGHMLWNKATHAEDPRLFGIAGRYHLVLFEGGYSKKLKTNWCYGNVHFDSINIIPPGHILLKDAFTKGVMYFESKLSEAKLAKKEFKYYSIDFGNAEGKYLFDGRSLVVMW